MILGIGVDVVQVERVDRWRDIPGMVERFFHEDEIHAIRQKGVSSSGSLAVRFAAKEAFAKALGTGLEGIALKDIKVENNEKGKPELKLFGTALARFEQLGGVVVHVSLTHEHDNAIAMVVIEGA